MIEQPIELFFQKVDGDPALSADLQLRIATASAAATASMAAEHNFIFGPEDLLRYLAKSSSELSSEQLEGVVAGVAGPTGGTAALLRSYGGGGLIRMYGGGGLIGG